MGRRLIIVALLVLVAGGLVHPDRSPATSRTAPPVEEVARALGALELTTSDRDTVVAEGLAFRQSLLMPGTASYTVRLQATPKPGRIAAHGTGPLVGSLTGQLELVTGTQEVVVPLSPAGARQIARRKLSRLIVTTTFADVLGRRATATSSVTVRR